jgi:hypothetical protein
MSEAQVAAENVASIYDAVREACRFVPVETVSAILVSDTGFLGHGVVSNISIKGACLITNTMIEPHKEIRVQFTVHRGDELFQVPAKVVWSAEGMDRNSEIVGILMGVAFQPLSDSQRKTIVEILERGLFHSVGPPDESVEPTLQAIALVKQAVTR